MKDNPLSDRIRLLHILDAIIEIESYIATLDLDAFLSNSLVKNATLMQIQIIGEAVSHINASLKKQYDYVEWQKIKGTRNIIAHEYFGIDYEIVWEIAKNNLPRLKEQVKAILNELPE